MVQRWEVSSCKEELHRIRKVCQSYRLQIALRLHDRSGGFVASYTNFAWVLVRDDWNSIRSFLVLGR